MQRILSTVVLAGLAVASSAAEPVRPAVLGEPMPAFELPSLQGGSVSLAGLRGRNVVIMFPRVQYGEGKWCTICNYGYAELAALDAEQAVRKQANAEIVFVVPFGREVAQRWIDATPAELAKVRAWKEPAERNEKTLAFADRARRLLALDLDPAAGARGLPFPILLDADRALTTGLDLFRTEWAGARAEQAVPAVFVLDTTGVVRYKHVAQASTWDRPTGREILDVLRRVAASDPTEPTRKAIVQTARDYVEGWYEGNRERMQRALHPDLAKRKVVADGQASKLRAVSAAELVAGAKPRGLAAGQRIEVDVLDVSDSMATVKIVSPLFVDYAHLVRWNGTWKVLNVAWE